MENWLLLIVGIIFLVCIVAGYIRGFFKIGLSLLSTLLTVLLIGYLSPYVSSALTKYTPADELIQAKIIDTFMPEITSDMLEKADLTGTPLAGLSQDQLKNLDSLTMRQEGITTQDILNVIGEMPKDQQIQEIQNSGMPVFLKNLLMENNNKVIYEELGVKSFPEYVAAYISRMVLNILSFVVSFLLAIIIVKALMVAVHILGELPGIGLLNHLGGAVLGVGMALLLVWIGFLVVTLAYSTDIGKSCFDMIEKSQILTLLYSKNPLLLRLLSFQ